MNKDDDNFDNVTEYGKLFENWTVICNPAGLTIALNCAISLYDKGLKIDPTFIYYYAAGVIISAFYIFFNHVMVVNTRVDLNDYHKTFQIYEDALKDYNSKRSINVGLDDTYKSLAKDHENLTQTRKKIILRHRIADTMYYFVLLSANLTLVCFCFGSYLGLSQLINIING